MSLEVDLSGGQLTVDGVDLITPAWSVTNLVRLWRPPTMIVLNRRKLGGGRKAYPPVRDQLTVTVDIAIIGDVDHEDEPYADPSTGLESNLNYLLANVILPTSPVRTGVLTMPSGAQRSGPVVFGEFPIDGYGGDTIETTLEIVFPDGLAPVAV